MSQSSLNTSITSNVLSRFYVLISRIHYFLNIADNILLYFQRWFVFDDINFNWWHIEVTWFFWVYNWYICYRAKYHNRKVLNLATSVPKIIQSWLKKLSTIDTHQAKTSITLNKLINSLVMIWLKPQLISCSGKWLMMRTSFWKDSIRYQSIREKVNPWEITTNITDNYLGFSDYLSK